MPVQGDAAAGNAVTSTEPPKAEEGKSTYGQILKSTALVGGASVANIVIGMIRTKVLAIFLGPAGFGLFGLYGSIVDVAQSVAGLGVNSSGVRQIADAVGSGDPDRVARTAAVLRHVSVILGLLGASVLVVFSRQISTLTFGNTEHAAGISLLAAAVLFREISAAQGALVQGMRRIADLAKLSVLGAVFGVLISIPIVYFLRERGVAPSLVGVAAMSILTSWWYSRKIKTRATTLTHSQLKHETAALVKLGFAFMASGLMMMGSAYVVRIIIVHKLGLNATGLYQSSWTLGGLYIGFVLQAMGADFYPRLTARAADHIACNRMVNEQAQVGMLLGGPGVLATLTFAPVVITLFYTAEFEAAVGLLRWISLGGILRAINWPLGFIILAKGEQSLFFWSELAWTTVNVGLTWILIEAIGLDGAGIAFFGAYVFHGVLIYVLVRRLTGFRWTRENTKLGLVLFGAILALFFTLLMLPFPLFLAVGLTTVLVSLGYAVRVLARSHAFDWIPGPMRRAADALGR
ncbi:MAG TPA: O-antigen translocase [Bryobacteraceae bacterium]|nr:O-antigen translocase [Bryobacteraceae bacterium]